MAGKRAGTAAISAYRSYSRALSKVGCRRCGGGEAGASTLVLGRSGNRSPSGSEVLSVARRAGLGGARTIVGRAGKSAWAESVASASVDAVLDAISRPSAANGDINDPTVAIADPRGINGVDLKIDLQRRARSDLWQKYGELAGSADPFKLVQGEMSSLSEGIKSLLGSDHPVLEACAKYFFELDGGKKIRPTMVLLVAEATGYHQRLMDLRGTKAAHHGKAAAGLGRAGVLLSQKRLAEITEMIHTASLFHDDVIDEADARRGVASINKLYGNKMAVLAGDFLLARASVSLARLRDVEVVELLSTVIEHLVKGEVMQSRPVLEGHSALEYYLHKNYYKTGSLMANSCRAAVMLGGLGEDLEEQAFAYGRHVGLAFQLVDDILDFEQSSEILGKPALSDIKQGLATAPVLIAAQEFPELTEVIKRKFRGPGDVERTLELVARSEGLARAKDLAQVQAEQAIEAVLGLSPSPAREGLIRLAMLVVNRTR